MSKRFVTFKTCNIGSGEPEGEISVSVDGVIALEPVQGGQMTVVTLQGGRSFTTYLRVEKVKAALANRRPAPSTTEPLSHMERVWGRGFLRDFFNMGPAR